jgi:hypothetical protein
MEDLLQAFEVLKDPRASILVLLWLVLEVRGLRRKVGLLFAGHGDQEARIRVLEERTGIPVARPAAQV